MEDFKYDRIDSRIAELKNDLVRINADVEACTLLVDRYHKEKNDCLQTCKDYMCKTNELMINEARHDEKINSFHDIAEELKEGFKKMETRVYMISGGILAVSSLLPFLLKKISG